MFGKGYSSLIIHILDSMVGMPVLSDTEIDFGSDFADFLKEHIFGLVPFKSVNYIDVSATDPQKEAERYAKILAKQKTNTIPFTSKKVAKLSLDEINFFVWDFFVVLEELNIVSYPGNVAKEWLGTKVSYYYYEKQSN